MMILTATFLLLLASPAFVETTPQCSPHSNGTTFNGMAGSEKQLKRTTVRKIRAVDAIQGVAVDKDYLFSIDDYSITKHNKTTGKRLVQWYGGDDGSIIHLDGDVVINGAHNWLNSTTTGLSGHLGSFRMLSGSPSAR